MKFKFPEGLTNFYFPNGKQVNRDDSGEVEVHPGDHENISALTNSGFTEVVEAAQEETVEEKKEEPKAPSDEAPVKVE